jgi:UDP-glucose 4-epimerase
MSTPQPRALVTGATGSIGPALVNHLLASGWQVRTYGLDTPADGLYAGPVDLVQGDINDSKQLAAAMAGIEVVFHLAALLHIENPAPELAAQYRRVNVDGSRVVAEQSARAGVRRLVYFSTVKVYGIRQRAPVSENIHPYPKTFYAQTKLAGEDAVRAAERIESVVLRLSAVYGPCLKGSWNRLVHAIERGRFLPVGNLRNAHSLTYVDDVARAALLAAEHPRAAGEIFNVVGHADVTLYDILDAIYTATGRRLPPVRVPKTAALIGTSLLEKSLALVNKRSPITPDMVRQFTEDEVYDGGKLRQIGFAELWSLNEGWNRAVHSQRGKPCC